MKNEFSYNYRTPFFGSVWLIICGLYGALHFISGVKVSGQFADFLNWEVTQLFMMLFGLMGFASIFSLFIHIYTFSQYIVIDETKLIIPHFKKFSRTVNISIINIEEISRIEEILIKNDSDATLYITSNSKEYTIEEYYFDNQPDYIIFKKLLQYQAPVKIISKILKSS